MEKPEKNIEEAAHKNYPYGSQMSIGSRDRSLYEHRKEAWIAGALSPEAKEFHTQGMYSEEEVRKIATEFFYFWWNAPGNNTEEGFYDWWCVHKKQP